MERDHQSGAPEGELATVVVEPVSVGITVPSTVPKELLDRVTAMAEDLAGAGIAVELETIRTCRNCGCTDDRACFGGCAWVSETEDLCTSCALTTRSG